MSCTERIILLVVAGALLVAAPVCAGGSKDIPTVKPQLLPLAGPLADPLAEVSGMTWQGDTLVIIPQFPDKFADEGLMGFFALTKQEILDTLDSEDGEPFQPHLVLCSGPGLLGIVRGFDGLEAMCCIGQHFYMTVEANEDTVMAGYLVSGQFDMVDGVVIMDMTRMSSIPMGLNIPNIAEETIIIDGRRVITISEANGLIIERVEVHNEEGPTDSFMRLGCTADHADALKNTLLAAAEQTSGLRDFLFSDSQPLSAAFELPEGTLVELAEQIS